MTAPAPVGDEMVLPVMEGLLACLTEALSVTPLGPPCTTSLRHVDTGPILDDCDCSCTDDAGATRQGHAYVRHVQTLPDPQVNRSGVELPMGAWPGWYVTLELAVTRCWPLTEDGSALPADQQTDLARQHLADAAALRRAVRCCTALGEYSWEWVASGAIGPDGGCAGNVATIAVRTTRDW